MTSTIAWAGKEPLLPWVEVYHKDSGGSSFTYRFSTVPLADPSTYNGGFKEARIVSFDEPIANALSDSSGQLRLPRCAFTLSDLPWSSTAKEPTSGGSMTLRGWLGDADTVGVIGADVVIKLVTDTDRRASTAATTVFRGKITAYEALSDYLFHVECEALNTELTITPPLVSLDFSATAPSENLGRTIPIIYGEISDETAGTPIGLIQPIYVGIFTADDASTWYGWVLCCHAIKELQNAYATSTLDVTGNVVNFDDIDWTKPGTAGFGSLFSGSDPYRTGASGYRYYMFYGSTTAPGGGPLGVVGKALGLSCNVKGIEATGDGSGALVSNIYDQIAHVMDNFVLDDTPPTGNWNSSIPTWSDGTAKRDATAYSTAKTAAAAAMPSGSDGAFMIFEPVSARDLVADLCISGDCDQAFNTAGQHSIYIDSAASSVTFTESDHIIAGSFRMRGARQDLQNSGAANCSPTYIAQYAHAAMASEDNVVLGFAGSVSSTDSTSVARHGTVTAATVNLMARRDSAQAQEVIDRRIARYAEPRSVFFSVGLHHFLSDGWMAGVGCTVTHRQGATSAGWAGYSHLYARECEFDLQNMLISAVCDDLSAGSP